MPDPKMETWKNTSLGTKWYKCFDVQGRDTTKVVRGGATFMLSTLERQMNQEAARPAADLFRNGTFVMKKSSDETNEEEIASPNSLTDSQLELIHREVTHGDERLEDYLANIDSLVTLQRLKEVFVADDASTKRDMDSIKERMRQLDPAAIDDKVVLTRPAPTEKPIKVSTGGAVIPEPTKVT